MMQQSRIDLVFQPYNPQTSLHYTACEDACIIKDGSDEVSRADAEMTEILREPATTSRFYAGSVL